MTGGSITGNNKVWKKISFSSITTSKIRVLTNAAVDNGYSRITEVEAWVAPPPTNFALSSNGATATASSLLNSNFPAAAVNNGDRKGTNWGNGGGWADSSSGTFPDWVQIDFNGNKTINEVDVFTLQDNYTSPSEPTESMTFSSYGLSGYNLQYWDCSAWVTVNGGSISGNNKVWRKVSFSSITTTKIRVLTNAAVDNGYSRITELEAWGTDTTSGTTNNINWLVSDQLGTPRMIFDQGGSLVTTKRHDYAPFGEELFNGARTTAMGYSATDGVRQKFNQKERDNETGLDYFLARYYASTQGRFTGVDPQNIVFEKEQGRNAGERARILQSYLVQPQNWNKYAYTRNNPLAYTDPNGRCSAPSGLSKGNVGICIEAFIASPTIGSGLVHGVGDNRGFAANDSSKTFRIEAMGTVTPGRGSSGWSYDLKGNAGVSQAVVAGVEVDRQGAIKFDVKTTSIDNDGNAHLAITMTGVNGFSGLPGAPAGAITLNVNLVVTPDGKVGVEGGDRTAYPSVGIYAYTMGSDGQPRAATLGEGKETTIDALTKPTVPIQPVAPKCNCEKKPEDRRRGDEED